MRILLLMTGLLMASAASADVYRSVDESGNVIFTDKPSPDAEKIDIAPVQTITTDPAQQQFEYTPPARKQTESISPYNKVEITSPEHDTALRENVGDVSVSVTVDPGLISGHKVVLYMDGNVVAEGSGQFNLTNIDRGTHTLIAAIQSNDGRELIRSAPVTFTVLRHSIQHKPSTVGKPPAK
jgi:hypothetical protein